MWLNLIENLFTHGNQSNSCMVEYNFYRKPIPPFLVYGITSDVLLLNFRINNNIPVKRNLKYKKKKKYISIIG